MFVRLDVVFQIRHYRINDGSEDPVLLRSACGDSELHVLLLSLHVFISEKLGERLLSPNVSSRKRNLMPIYTDSPSAQTHTQTLSKPLLQHTKVLTIDELKVTDSI